MIRTATHLAIALAAIATAFLMSTHNRTVTARERAKDVAAGERAKDDEGAISLEMILVALGLSMIAAAAIALILAAVRSKGAGL